MKPLGLALKYMDILFSGKNIDELSDLLADKLTFSGPFYQFETAQDYIESLKSEPPKQFQYKIIQSFETESSVCIIYQFQKPGISVPMAQLFEISQSKISKILLIFDSGAFT